ncbi:MAG: helix-turn-helix domain-containing protein [Bacteroides sp.]
MTTKPLQKPQKLDLALLSGQGIVKHKEYRFIASNFGYVNSFREVGSSLFRKNQPYQIEEKRIVFIRQGSGKVLVNLIEYELVPNMLILVPGRSIIELRDYTVDFNLQMMAIGDDLILPHGNEEFFGYFLNSRPTLSFHLSPDEVRQVDLFFTLIWDILQEPSFREKAIGNLIKALLHQVESSYQTRQENKESKNTHQEEIFQRFIGLVNEHCKTERRVDYYANKLCLTPRYLNTVIRQISGQTVMDWIDQAIVLEAKVMLKHSNALIFEISDKLNFPNPSFFCKFFKKKVGMTPKTYQKE